MLTKSSIFLLIYQLEGDVLKSYFMMMASSICLCRSDHYCCMCFEVMLLNRPISNSSIILVILKLLSTRIGSLSTSDAVRMSSPLCWLLPTPPPWVPDGRFFIASSPDSSFEPHASCFCLLSLKTSALLD